MALFTLVTNSLTDSLTDSLTHWLPINYYSTKLMGPCSSGTGVQNEKLHFGWVLYFSLRVHNVLLMSRPCNSASHFWCTTEHTDKSEDIWRKFWVKVVCISWNLSIHLHLITIYSMENIIFSSLFGPKVFCLPQREKRIISLESPRYRLNHENVMK